MVRRLLKAGHEGVVFDRSSKAVTFVTDSNEEEGFAQAIERFVLNQTSISLLSSSSCPI